MSVWCGLFWCVPPLRGEVPDKWNIIPLLCQSLTSSEVSTWSDQGFWTDQNMTLLQLAQTSATSCG